MKKWILAVLISATIALVPACKNKDTKGRADEKNVISTNDIPGKITSAFAAKYPGATEVIWEDAHEGDSPTFKVKFKRENKYWKAEFKGDGTLIKEKED